MRSILLPLISLFFVIESHAQCGTCTPDTDCILSPAYPTLCPSTLPDATVGEPYETDVSFYMPNEFYDPDNGVDVVFNQVTVTGTTGLPFGMSIELNELSGIYLPAENEHGCARLCGTPISPGEYNISINIVAAVFIPSFGIEVNQNQAFELSLTVLPGSGGNNSFTLDVNSGCDSLWVNFEALLDASPSPTSWSWDFGNGETSDLKIPPTQYYGDTGTYEVSLETQFLEYVITSVQVNSVNGNWCGDAEEVTCDGLFGILPDIYVQIRDANSNLLYQSNSTENTLTGSWSDLNIVATNPPFTVQVWDEDAVTANDDLGSFSFNITGAGTVPFSGGGGTSGSIAVDTQVGDTFFNTETITVFPSPQAILEYDEASSILAVATDSSIVNYTWFYNGELFAGQNGSSIAISEPGEYYAVVQNGFGCSATSEVFVLCPVPEISYDSGNNILSSVNNFPSYQWFYEGAPIPDANLSFYIPEEGAYGWYSLFVTTGNGCAEFSDSLLVCPSVEITVSEDGSTLSVPDEYESYLWVQNGIPISGETGPTLELSTAGNTYWVVVTTDYGCEISAPPIVSSVSVEDHLSDQNFTLFPNPAQNGFNIRFTAELKESVAIVLADMNGRTVKDYGNFNNTDLGQQWFGLEGVSSGKYLIVISSGEHRNSLQLIVH